MRSPARTPVFAARLLAGFVPVAALIAATVEARQPPPALPDAAGPALRTNLPLA